MAWSCISGAMKFLFNFCILMPAEKERKKVVCFCVRGVSERSKQLLGGVRYPGKESCAQEHQDSLLGDCVGKSQQVSLLLWLPATFQAWASSVWAAGSAGGLCQWQGSQAGRVRGARAVRTHWNCCGGGTNAPPLLWPRPTPWAKRHLYLPISPGIWYGQMDARLWL